MWCILITHNFQHIVGNTFSITLPSDDSVEDLKKKIHEKRQNNLPNITVDKLRLWKLRNPHNTSEIKEEGFLASRVLLKEVPTNTNEDEVVDNAVWPLDPEETISLHLPHLLSKVSVLVQVPALLGGTS